MSTGESIGETVSVMTLFSHGGVYVMAIGSLIPTGFGYSITTSSSADLPD